MIGDDPFGKSEEEMIKEYNSSISIPQLVFLGVDESKDEIGLNHKIYTGAPYFALDVTPKGTYEEKAKSIIAEMEKQGLEFKGGRMNLTLPAGDGTFE